MHGITSFEPALDSGLTIIRRRASSKTKTQAFPDSVLEEYRAEPNLKKLAKKLQCCRKRLREYLQSKGVDTYRTTPTKAGSKLSRIRALAPNESVTIEGKAHPEHLAEQSGYKRQYSVKTYTVVTRIR